VDKPLIDALVGRVERLEIQCDTLRRQAGRWKRFGIGVSVGMFVIVIGGARLGTIDKIVAAEMVWAKRIELSDSEGTIRATLGVSKEGSVELNFFNSNRQNVLTLATDSEGTSGLSVSGKDGKQRISLNANPDESMGLSFSDKEGKDLLGLVVTSEGHRGMVAYGDDGKPRLRLAHTKEGPALVCNDEAGKYRIGFGLNSASAASLRVLSKEGRDLIGLGVSPDDAPVLNLRDRQGHSLFNAPEP
jgi:hypothetical protein